MSSAIHIRARVTVPDSHFIGIQYLVGHDLIKDPDDLANLTAAQKAESMASQAYVEELLYSAVVYDRWYIDENYAIMAEEIFGDIPWPLRYFMSWVFRKRVQGVMYFAGMGKAFTRGSAALATRSL